MVNEIYFLKKYHSGTLSECQTVQMQIRVDSVGPDLDSTVISKGDQETTAVALSKERV